MTARDPNFKKASTNQLFFPMHRVRAIMKQDPYYTTSAENVSAMTKTVEYFGEYLLEEVRKVSEGKKRVDASELFDAINTNQSQLWFLNCLIDEHNMENEGQKKQDASKKEKKP